MKKLQIAEKQNLWLIAILACIFTIPAHSQIKSSQYVFNLLDTDFVVKKRIFSSIRCEKLPDSSALMNVLNSIDVMGSVVPMGHIKPSTQPVGDVWLGYMPPADPGAIVFLSNTYPTYPLLTLHIDAMCQGCANRYETFGSTETPLDQTTRKRNVKVLQLENEFGLGGALLDSEKTMIADKINDYSLSNSTDTFSVYVLKIGTEFPSVEGIRYICYYSIVTGSVSSVYESKRKNILANKVAGSEIDALGRRIDLTSRKWTRGIKAIAVH
jgi:hypothetical protein